MPLPVSSTEMVVMQGDFCHRTQDTVPPGRVVQGVFDEVSNGLGQPCLVTEEAGLLVPHEIDLLSLLPGPEGILLPNMLQQFRNIFRRLFQGDGPGIQPSHL